jgi:hypothetical protein
MSLALHLHVRAVDALYAAAAGQASWTSALEALLLLGWHSTHARNAQLVDAVGHASRALLLQRDAETAAVDRGGHPAFRLGTL